MKRQVPVTVRVVRMKSKMKMNKKREKDEQEDDVHEKVGNASGGKGRRHKAKTRRSVTWDSYSSIRRSDEDITEVTFYTGTIMYMGIVESYHLARCSNQKALGQTPGTTGPVDQVTASEQKGGARTPPPRRQPPPPPSSAVHAGRIPMASQRVVTLRPAIVEAAVGEERCWKTTTLPLLLLAGSPSLAVVLPWLHHSFEVLYLPCSLKKHKE
ncbi:hypothetical protein Sjap_025833 [Stephania japonica]|uniref:Uncharacterized protein n=1 Tax=Stephania japonica TaxID=461633 RepID=A0AAP0HHX0_9MAGN